MRTWDQLMHYLRRTHHADLNYCIRRFRLLSGDSLSGLNIYKVVSFPLLEHTTNATQLHTYLNPFVKNINTLCASIFQSPLWWLCWESKLQLPLLHVCLYLYVYSLALVEHITNRVLIADIRRDAAVEIVSPIDGLPPQTYRIIERKENAALITPVDGVAPKVYQIID